MLNAEGVLGPGGRPWGDTTIRGQVDRGTGLLNNPLYVGRLEWNRTSYVKDPRTGRRTARVNAPNKREVVEVPELRIVDDDLWARVKARQAEVHIEMGKDVDGNALNRAHRRQFLLSGLLVCGECGGSYTIVGKDRYGCATRRSKGTCSNGATITRQAIEERVLGGLKDRLLAPELVKEFVAEYQAEMNRTAREATHKAAALRQDLGAIERKIAGIVRAIEDGAYNPTLTRRLTELEQQKAAAERTLAAAGAPPVVFLHPNLAEVYRLKVARLEEALNTPGVRAEAAEILRSLIDRIVLRPRPEGDGMAAELVGDLAAILTMCGEAQNGKGPSRLSPGGPSQLSVVAGTRNHLYRTSVRWP
jgi:site-specific DNA recombinase